MYPLCDTLTAITITCRVCYRGLTSECWHTGTFLVFSRRLNGPKHSSDFSPTRLYRSTSIKDKTEETRTRREPDDVSCCVQGAG
jgi:hypothetical protein